MKEIVIIYKMELLIFLIFLLLVSWAITSTSLALSHEDKTYLIAISGEETRAITEGEVDKVSVEVVNFIRRFVALIYNYDDRTFEENIKLAGDLMSLDLWNEQARKVERVKLKLRNKNFSHSGVILGVNRISQDRFEVPIRMSIVRDNRNKTFSRRTNLAMSVFT